MDLHKFFKYSLPIGIVGFVLNLILFATNGFYELVVPVLENSSLDGSVFTFFDDLIFYTPCIFMVLFAAYLVAGQIYLKKIPEENEERIASNHIRKNQKELRAIEEKAEFLKNNYYTNCPNCGSAREADEKICSYCSASLVIEYKNK